MFDLFRRFTMGLVGIALPFETSARIDLGFYVITPIKVATALLLVLVVLQWGFARGSRSYASRGKAVWVLLFFFAILVATMQSYFLGGSDFRFAVSNVLTTWISLVVLYFLLTYTVRSLRDLDAILRGLVVGVSLVVGTALLGIGGNVQLREGARLTGEAGNPNNLAASSAVAIPTIAALLLTDRSRLWKPLYLAAIALAGVGLVGSLSRAGYVAALGMGGLWMVRFRKLRMLPYALPVVILLFTYPLWLPEAAAQRIETMSSPGQLDPSARGRLTSLPYAAAAFVSNPVFGVGMLRTIPWTLEHYGTHTGVIHNAFIQIAVETGLLGFVPFAFLWALSWRNLSQSWRAGRRLRGLRDPSLRQLEFRATFLQIAFFGLFINGQFHPSMKSKLVWLLFALSTVLVGITRDRVRTLEREGARRGEASRAPVAAGPGALPPLSAPAR